MPEIKRYEVANSDVNIFFYFDFHLASVFGIYFAWTF